MPWIRYKHSGTDARPAWKGIVGSREYVFMKSDGGLCHVARKDDANALIRHVSNNYELAYEKHGIHFDEHGVEISVAVSSPPPSDAPKPQKAPSRPAPPTRHKRR